MKKFIVIALALILVSGMAFADPEKTEDYIGFNVGAGYNRDQFAPGPGQTRVDSGYQLGLSINDYVPEDVFVAGDHVRRIAFVRNDQILVEVDVIRNVSYVFLEEVQDHVVVDEAGDSSDSLRERDGNDVVARIVEGVEDLFVAGGHYGREPLRESQTTACT